MKKTVFIIAALAAVSFVILSFTVYGGFEEMSKMSGVAALIYGVSRVLAAAVKRRDKEAIFTGALGLGILAAGGLYALASLHVKRFEDINLSVEDFSDACSYLFFFAVISLMLIPSIRRKKMFLTWMNGFYAVMMILIIYSIVANNRNLLCITAVATAFLCVLLSAYLLYLSKKESRLETARCFAYSMICLGVLDMAVYPLFLMETGLRWYHRFSALYAPVFIWICEGLLLLGPREGSEPGG